MRDAASALPRRERSSARSADGGELDAEAGSEAGDEGAAAEPRKHRPLLHLGLFLATLLTTTMAGAEYVHPQGTVRPLADGLAFSVPLLLILLCHELGHYITARIHGVDASLPFFIPLPFIGVGTLGAVIGMRGITADRRKLIDVGAAGPLAGLVVAIPVLLYGLHLSKVGPVHPGLLEGNSILYAVLKYAVTGEWLPNAERDVALHPTAYAGWVGLLITMINLLPIGQLDGGHIASSYFGNRFGRASRRIHRFLPVLAVAVFVWVFLVVGRELGGNLEGRWRVPLGAAGGAAMPWVTWFGMVALVQWLSGSAEHPGVDPEPLPRSRRILFWIVVSAFALIFMPLPNRATFAGATAADLEAFSAAAAKADHVAPARAGGGKAP